MNQGFLGPEEEDLLRALAEQLSPQAIREGKNLAPRLLFIEPQQPPSDRPVIDDLTRKLAGAYRLSRRPHYVYRGFHFCSCGAGSDDTDHYLPDGTMTNSLCVHYLAYHRHEVPEAALEFVRRLSAVGVEPTTDELHGIRVIGPSPKPIDHLRTQYLEPLGK